MSDLFKCDHCQVVSVKTDKAGVIIIEQCRWGNTGIAFPNIKLHTHDLCKGCLSKIIDLISKKPLPIKSPQMAMVVDYRDPPRVKRSIKFLEGRMWLSFWKKRS